MAKELEPASSLQENVKGIVKSELAGVHMLPDTCKELMEFMAAIGAVTMTVVEKSSYTHVANICKEKNIEAVKAV